MKFKETFELRKIGGEDVAVQTGSTEVNMGRIISFNESSLLVYNKLKNKDFSLQDVADVLISEYDVEPSVAERDSKELVEALIKSGILAD